MRLLSLRIRNFKGIPEFEFASAGRDANIYGDNATGKTTIWDAFCWLLFDKDSNDAKDFSIKPLDPRTGGEIHHIETEVEGTFEIDGKTVVLARKFYEKWTKRRGSASAEFSGHTTDHFVDHVPVTASEYKMRISQIVDEATFKLLTSPTYFNEQLHWQERREILLAVCGDVTDADVIASDPALAALPGILAGHKMDDHRRMITARRRQINDELDKIPVRIDEIMRGLPAEMEIPPADEIAHLRAERDAKQAELTRIEHGGEIAEKEKVLAQAEADLLRIGTAERGRVLDQVAVLRRQIGELEEQIRELRPIADVVRLADTSDIERQIEQLRAAWYEADARTWTGPETCPTCGQPLPAEQIEAARARFNQRRAEDLECITAAGRQAKADLERIHAENEERQRRAAEAQAQINVLNDEIRKIQSEIDAINAAPHSPEYQIKEREIEGIKAILADLRAGGAAAVSPIRAEIDRLNRSIATQEAVLAAFEQREKGLARIAELEAQQRTLAAEFERLEYELNLCDEFIRHKVSLLTDRINSKFQLARFKLFETQINGGIAECCETLYGGVPYSSGLNSGHRIIVGLDIIRTLSEHYGFTAPVWIDNRESITRLPGVPAQVISLVVSERDKTLRVEVDNDGDSTTVQPQQERVPTVPAGAREYPARRERRPNAGAPGGVFGSAGAPDGRAGSR